MKTLIIDDHKLFAEGLKQLLCCLIGEIEVDLAETIEKGFVSARQNPLDLVIFDLYMPGSQGVSTLKRFINTFPLCPVLVVSACDHRPTIQKVLEVGAMGFVSKASPLAEMRKAVHCVLAGDVYYSVNRNGVETVQEIKGGFSGQMEQILAATYGLTPRQLNVLSLIVRGHTNKEIGAILRCTEGTVKIHVSTILKSLGVKNRTEAVWIVEQTCLLSQYQSVAATVD